MEQRLSDTESALYDVVAKLQRINAGLNPSSTSSRQARLNSTRPSKRTKTSRLAEWTMYPLKSSEDIERWWVGLREDDVIAKG